MGEQPGQFVKETVQRVLPLVERMSDSLILSHPVGGMRLIDYLPAVTMELIIHTMDIASAFDVEVQPPAASVGVTLRLLADLATETARGGDVALVLTGRQSLPEGFNLLA